MRTIKFRTPHKCQSGHFRWWYTEISRAEWRGHWGKKNCDCPTDDIAQGFDAVGDDQQFTGLLDKNGKEIYEGDIFMDDEDGTCNFVEWNDAFGGWGTNEWFLPKDLVEQTPFLEVIGNIYENPELLTL